MRSALLDSLGRDRGGSSRASLLAAPVKGWNTRDALAAMDPLYAPFLVNWFPRSGQLELRGGSSVWASGVTGGGRSLFQYTPATGTAKIFAASDSGIFDATAGGAVGAAVTPSTNGYWNGVNITNAANNSFLWIANGTDKVRTWDGAVWNILDGASTPAITGVATTDIIFPWNFKHRIFFIVKNSMTAGFLPLDSIGGAVGLLPQGNLFRKGGHLISGGAWTLDAGEGPDDLMALISSEGQLAIYKGIDPTSASNWALVGIWDVGRPLGSRCFFKLGGDVCVLVESGVYPLSKLLQSGQLNYNTALTNKIQPTVAATTAAVGINTQGWCGVVYPAFDALIVNVPTQQTQWVMNTVTGALSSFNGWAASDFMVRNGVLYFCSGTNVYLAWDGSLSADIGTDIATSCHTAYTDYGDPTRLKKVDMFRPLLAYDGAVQLQYGISVDYTDITVTNLIPRSISSTSTAWDTSPWNTSPWAAALKRQKIWRTAFHPPGFTFSLWLQTASNGSKLYWSGTDYILHGGGQM